MKRIEFSVLQYYPSFVTGERINLGILIHCTEENFIKFIHIDSKHYNRLRSFDDELDVDIVSRMLNMLSEDVEEQQLPFLSEKPFNMKEYIRYFTNEFRFSAIASADYESTEAAVEELKNVYFRLYIPKTERANKSIEFEHIARIIKNKGYDYYKKSKVKDDFGLDVTYDFMLENNTGIKYFNLSKKNINKMMTYLRSWAWIREHSIHSKMENFIIVYSCEDSFQQDPTLIKALEMFKSENHSQYFVNISALTDVLATLKIR